MSVFLPWLIDAGWQAAVMAIILGLLLMVMGRRIPAAWRYAALFLVVVRLLLPSLPEAPISAYRMVPSTPAAAWEQSLPTARVPAWLESRPGESPMIMTGTSRPKPVQDWKTYAGFAWIIGAGGLAAWLVVRQFLFHLARRRRSRAVPPEISGLLQEVSVLAGLRRVPRLDVLDALPTPALTGLFRPVILLPAEFANRLPATSLRHILLHECIHIRRGDLWTHFLTLVATVIHWWNPMVWWLLRRLHVERELATDAGVLRCLRAEERGAYGETLLDLATGPTLRGFLQPSLGVLERHAVLRRRIRQIAGFGRTPVFVGTIGIVLLAAVATTLMVREPSAPLDPIPEDTQSRERITQDFIDRVRANDLPAVQRYLQRGLDINVTNHYNNALYWAVTDENFPMVRFLVQNGARVNDKNRSGDTPVRRACWLGNKKIADFLIASGATCDPLLYHAGMGELSALEKLNSEAALPLKQLRQVAQFACAANQQATFDWAWKLMKPQMDDSAQQKFLGSCLVDAASWGRLPMLKHLVGMGVDIRKNGDSALARAALWNHPAEARYLLEQGVPIKTEKGSAGLLRNVAGEGYVEVMKALLDHGADINEQDAQGYTPLAWAASSAQEEASRLLIERGADITTKNSFGRTALWLAANSGNSPEIVELLLRKGAAPGGVDRHGAPILSAIQNFIGPRQSEASRSGKTFTKSEILDHESKVQKVVELLIESGADMEALDANSRTPLGNALSGSHPEIAMTLMRKGASVTDTDPWGNEPLCYAVQGLINAPLPIKVIKELLKRGANPNASFFSPYTTPRPPSVSVLEVAVGMAGLGAGFENAEARRERVEVIEYLLEQGASFPVEGDSRGRDWLAAAATGNLSLLQKLLAEGVDINTTSKEGWNALSIALALRREDETRWLMDRGISLHGARDMTSPLYFATLAQDVALAKRCLAAGAIPTNGVMGAAAESGNVELFETLRLAGGDASHVPLYTLVRQGYSEILRVAIENGADVRTNHNSENRNHVYWAVYYNQPEVLKVLLEAGVEPNMRDSYGQSTLDYAKKFRPKLVPMLEEAIRQGEARNQGGA